MTVEDAAVADRECRRWMGVANSVFEAHPKKCSIGFQVRTVGSQVLVDKPGTMGPGIVVFEDSLHPPSPPEEAEEEVITEFKDCQLKVARL